jgi:RNA polymerase sigma-70 factor (ECF subfamily)
MLTDDVPAPVRSTSVPAETTTTTTTTADMEHEDQAFLSAWRAEMMNQAWSALQGESPTQHAVLLYYVDHPDCTAREAAAALADPFGRVPTSGNIRIALHRARERFAELITGEVARTLGSPTRKELAEELRILNLSRLCKRSLRGWGEINA